MPKIIFFTAGIEATEDEATAIANLVAAASVEVVIRNASAPVNGAMIEAADYVAGTLPASGDYDEINTFDPLAGVVVTVIDGAVTADAYVAP